MGCMRYLEDLEQRMIEQVQRGRAAGLAGSELQLNLVSQAHRRSMGQIFDHMRIAHAPYLKTIREALGTAPPSSGDALRLTFVGKFLMRAAGPDGNAPTPKAMAPGEGPFTKEVVDSWSRQSQEVLDCLRLAKTKDVCSVKVRNPFLPILRMNLMDCFGILVEHSERHVRQLESLADRAKSAT